MESFLAEPFEIVDRDDALSYWEFVNATDAVDSDSDFGVASFDDGVSSLHSSVSESASLGHSDDQSLDLTGTVVSVDRDFGVLGDVRVDAASLDHEALGVGHDLALSFNVNLVHDDVKDYDEGPQPLVYEYGWDYAYHQYSVCEEEYDEEEYDDDQDLDDELVPWSVNGKFRRQRMRKLGKKGFAKISSKKAPHTHVKPGCLHGKHGLGVKHSF